jgi:hypothetical protein
MLVPTGRAITSANCFDPTWPPDVDLPVVLRLAVRIIHVDTELPLYLAVMAAIWVSCTIAAEAVKVADVAPAGTVTAAGTVRAERLALSVTTPPFVGPGWLRITVQVPEELGPVGAG